MRLPAPLPLLALTLLAACGPPRIPIEQVDVKCTSVDDGVLRLYFRVADDAPCAGVRIERREQYHAISFVPAGEGPVDVAAEPFDGEPWGPCLVCPIELPEDVVMRGVKYHYYYVGREGSLSWLTTAPPKEPAPKD